MRVACDFLLQAATSGVHAGGVFSILIFEYIASAALLGQGKRA